MEKMLILNNLILFIYTYIISDLILIYHYIKYNVNEHVNAILTWDSKGGAGDAE